MYGLIIKINEIAILFLRAKDLSFKLLLFCTMQKKKMIKKKIKHINVRKQFDR